jgi:hypothetical protein
MAVQKKVAKKKVEKVEKDEKVEVKKTTKPKTIKAKTVKPKVEKAKKVEKVEPRVFDDDDLITVFSYFNGTLHLTSRDVNEYDNYVFEGFMDEQEVRYGFLRSLKRTKNKALSIPRIYIADDEAIESLKLTKLYDGLFNPKDLEKIFNKPLDEIVNIVDKADRNVKGVLRDIALAKIQNKELNNYSVIKVLSEKLNFHLQEEF